MARGKTLQDIADERGVTLETLVGQAIEEAQGNIFQAARLLGKYPNTIHNFLRTHPQFKLEIETKTTARLVLVNQPSQEIEHAN